MRIVLRHDDPPWREIPNQTWIDNFQVNFLSTLRMSQLFFPSVRESGWGRFINISTAGATLIWEEADGTVRAQSKHFGPRPAGEESKSTTYKDVLRRTPDGWRLAERVVILMRPRPNK